MMPVAGASSSMCAGSALPNASAIQISARRTVNAINARPSAPAPRSLWRMLRRIPMKHANEPGSKNLRRFVSFKLLSEQTEDVGMIMLALQKKKGKADREQGIRLEGIWNLLHII